MDLGQRGIQVETLEMFPAYKRQKSYLLAGILIDDISNYALLYNVHAIKKNGELHRGMDGFCQEKNMVQVPLTVLSEWERIECVDHEIFIVENPSVFALICGEKSCMCMNGQPRLAGLLVLELLAKSGTKVYYSGDLDPEGILIAQKLSQYYRGTFCYWHMTPFDYEQCRSKEILSEKAAPCRGCGNKIWGGGLSGKYRIESDFHLKNWLIRVTVNQCKMLFRSPWRKVEDIGEYAEKEIFRKHHLKGMLTME